MSTIRPARLGYPAAMPGVPEITAGLKLQTLEDLLAKIEGLERTVAEQQRQLDDLVTSLGGDLTPVAVETAVAEIERELDAEADRRRDGEVKLLAEVDR